MGRLLVLPLVLAALLLFPRVGRAQGYAEDFDPAPAGWRLTDAIDGAGWAFDGTPASFPSGASRSGNSLNFNNGSDYAGGTGGGALSPAIPLASLAHPVLRFWCNYETETRGTATDRRLLEIWSADGKTRLARWQLGSVGHSFDPDGGIRGGGPGPCAEAFDDLETGIPVTGWHEHRVFLDPAWGTVRVRFVFWSVDDLRNGYAGWAIDDLAIESNQTPAPTGWPDVFPDTAADEIRRPDGNELDVCERTGDLLEWSWGSNNRGDPGVHLVLGDHPDSILGKSYFFFDAVHGHLHFSQYADFSLWENVDGVGFVKLRRGPKRSFCLEDVEAIGPGRSVTPGCDGDVQVISYNWQDVYDIGTPGQSLDLSGLPSGTDYWLIGILDPLNRLRERNEMNQMDQIHFTLQAGDGQVPILDRDNPYPQTDVPLVVASAESNGPAIRLLGDGFDTSLVFVAYDSGTAIEEAPFYTIVSANEVRVQVPPGIAAPASLDVLRPRGDAVSVRIGASVPVPNAEPRPPFFVSARIDGVTPAGGPSPVDVTFTGSGEANVGPVEHSWDFGDGTPAAVFPAVVPGASTSPSHTYAAPGAYTCTLRVTDPDGVQAEHTVSVTATGTEGGSRSACGLMGTELLLLLGVIRILHRAA